MKAQHKINMSSRGYYSLTVLNKDGNRVVEKCTGTIGNVVTYDGAYHSLITGSSGMFGALYGAVGTGTTEITRDSTGLGTPVSGRTSPVGASRSGNEVDNLDGTSTITVTRTLPFSLGSKVGTFSEVGMYTDPSAGTFVAGQLIKDEFGNPTTITILSDEQLVITYTLEWVVPNSSKLVGTGFVTDAASNTYNYEVWAQPYFQEYNVGASTLGSRYFYTAASAQLGVRGSNGTSPRIDNPAVPGWSISRPTPDTVVGTSGSKVYSPTQLNYSGIVFLAPSAGARSGSNAVDVVDTVNVLGASGNGASAPCYIKFLTPIDKLNTQSFSITVELSLSI